MYFDILAYLSDGCRTNVMLKVATVRDAALCAARRLQIIWNHEQGSQEEMEP